MYGVFELVEFGWMVNVPAMPKTFFFLEWAYFFQEFAVFFLFCQIEFCQTEFSRFFDVFLLWFCEVFEGNMAKKVKVFFKDCFNFYKDNY